MNTPHDFSPSHIIFPNIFHIYAETDMYFMQISHLRSFRNTTGLCLHNRDNETKQVSSKASCELSTGGDMDTLYTHQYSFQILILPIRKVDGKYVFSIFHFSNFPKDIHTLSLKMYIPFHYFILNQTFLWLILITRCYQLAADICHLVYLGIWHIDRKL